MAKTWTVIGLCLIIVVQAHCKNASLGREPFKNHGICKNMYCNSLATLRRLKDCVVVLGYLRIAPLQRITKEDFRNMSFPKLREVTGHLVLYRVIYLESVGQLFPNLARIRGEELFGDYALIIFDMPNLREVGLYSLLAVDRGGVIVWGGPQTCHVRSVRWAAIAPHARHVLQPPDHLVYCSQPCRCSSDPAANYCWNIKKCQRFVSGPEAEICDEQCLGCRGVNDASDCAVCRYYTHRGACVPSCPNDTIVLAVNKYCLTEDECRKLDGWRWNNSCVLKCPVDYVRGTLPDGSTSCLLCKDCQKTCPSLIIQTITAMQNAEKCVFINGSLTIHVRVFAEGINELRMYLRRITEISDYLEIYGSLSINSLDFLPSLSRIKGRNLKNGKYSLVVTNMMNLQSLFTTKVLQNLAVDRGTVNMHHNPVLCKKHIDELVKLFPSKPDLLDVPPGMNGYSGGCDDVSIGLQVRSVDETSAVVSFTPVAGRDVTHTVLYGRAAAGAALVPETCSRADWHAAAARSDARGSVRLAALRPASVYAVCIETYDPVRRLLARSSIVNFVTPVGKPEPPFILELVAASYDVVVIRWVNHKDYRPHITHHQLDVTLVEIYEKDLVARDHCTDIVRSFEDDDISRHAIVMRPPEHYEERCETMCGVLSSVPVGAMVEENFEICSSSDYECNVPELPVPRNSTFLTYVRTLTLNISGLLNDFQIGGLAPFRDYRFQLRACVNASCSRSARNTVRTLAASDADAPSVSRASASAGHVSVLWNAPNITNGPLLTYTVQVTPNVHISSNGYLLPQTWCVRSNVTQLRVKSVVTDQYYVRVCGSSLASASACSEWLRLAADGDAPAAGYMGTKGYWLWGIVFGIAICTMSSAVGYCWKRKALAGGGDTELLVDSTSNFRNESDSPFTEFEFEFYSIPLH